MSHIKFGTLSGWREERGGGIRRKQIHDHQNTKETGIRSYSVCFIGLVSCLHMLFIPDHHHPTTNPFSIFSVFFGIETFLRTLRLWRTPIYERGICKTLSSSFSDSPAFCHTSASLRNFISRDL